MVWPKILKRVLDYSNSTVEVYKKDQILLNQIFERILVLLINDAVEAFYLGVASKEDIDLAVLKGVNYPKGLIQWGEEKTFSWVMNTLDDLHEKYHEDRYRCSKLVRDWAKKN